MKNGISKLAFLLLFTALSFQANAQTAGEGSTYLYTALIAVVAILILGVVLQVADSLMRIEAKNMGVEQDNTNFSLIPSWSDVFKSKTPDFAEHDRMVSLQAGHDIKLEGGAKKEFLAITPTTFAVKPTDFVGMSPIPKVEVEEGAEVKAGDVLFFDKKRPDVKYVAPVSGEIVAVNRGAKRSIAEVVILADKDQTNFRSYTIPNLNVSREELVEFLLGSGVWPMIRQRPYNVVADPLDIPKAIFISTFDSAPNAPDLNFVVGGKEAAFQRGLDVIAKLTEGKVHLGLDARGETAPSPVFTMATGVEKTYYNGPHPSGNVGIQIHHTDPISANERVWTLGVQDVITIGRLFLEGRYDAERIIAVTGAELEHTGYVKTYLGANLENMVKGNLKNDHVRVVSGDVLSGRALPANGHLGFYDDQITVLEEGDEYEMFGWLLPLSPRPTVSKTYPNFLFPNYKFTPNTNTHGEKRAFVVTGQYEKVLPMDVYPQQLMKAILVNDYERMEGLGIYELSEEDVALCEFVCTSKQPVQSILRQGLDMMREQG